MTLPNFIICGAQRAGTTSLFHYLKAHPQVYMAPTKEVHFFDLNYEKGIDWYEKHFRSSNPEKYKAVGEASPFYMYLHEVPERIYRHLPEVKLIFILRNPVDRAYSHYWHEVRMGYEWLTFEEALEKEEERLSTGDLHNIRHFSYKDRGKYARQLRNFMKFFSRDQLLILMYDDLKGSPHQVLSRVFEFLGVDPALASELKFKKFNVGGAPRIWSLQRIRPKLPGKCLKFALDLINLRRGYPAMDQRTRRYLIEYFRPFNRELEEIVERDLSSWELR